MIIIQKMQKRKMNYKAVFADLDRTLLNGEGHISEFTKKTIEKLLESGVDFVPCSGRSLMSFPKEIFEIRGIKHGVSSNGVSVDNLEEKKSLSYLVIPSDVPERVMKFLSGYDIAYEIFLDGQGYTPASYYENPKNFDEVTFKVDYIKTCRIPVEDMKSFILSHKSEIGSLDLILHPSDTTEVFEKLKAEFPEVYMTNSEAFLIEISNIECGKHNGLLHYCRMTGILPEEVVAFGDGNNDLEMLKTAGLGIAVGKATESCKNAAARVVETNEDDGVAREVRRIFLGGCGG